MFSETLIFELGFSAMFYNITELFVVKFHFNIQPLWSWSWANMVFYKYSTPTEYPIVKGNPVGIVYL